MANEVKAFFKEEDRKKRIECLEYAIEGIKKVKNTYGYVGQKICQNKIDKLNGQVDDLKKSS
ncbi:hypothetical protein V9L05_01460 [Bernardetia sp. Wsw4-3y2]|uniref:hypothetical protein n=1 Tax=Bernardetia sp. Wsw4-3y2 TaxID=3127471 RepID=UPI0030D6039F